MFERLVVIGGVAAGMSAAAKAKRVDRNLEVVVYEQSPYISYAACGMPYLIAGDITDYRELIVRTPEQMGREGVEVHVRHKATAIDAERKTVTVRNLQTGHEFSQPYDRLVIATGARPVELPGLQSRAFQGQSPGSIFSLRSLDSGIAVQRFVAEHAPQRAVIVGGGYIAVEMAETFRRLGLRVTLLIRSGQVMRTTLDDDVRELVHAELARQGVDIVKGTGIALEGNGHSQQMITEEGRYPCDMVLLGIGARPNVELAQQAGVALGVTGALATDRHMQTNLPDVYAAGDCTEALNLVTGEADYIPLGSTANKQGRTAGTNAAGGIATFEGVVGTLVVRAFDLAVASTGLTAADAHSRGYSVQETMIRAKDTSHYFPGAADIHVKLVADRDSGRLLGGQIVGQPSVAKRIDVLVTALHCGMSLSDLQRLDLSYAPPFAPVWDPILVAANVAA